MNEAWQAIRALPEEFIPRSNWRLFWKLCLLTALPMLGLVGACAAVYVWQVGGSVEHAWLVKNLPVVDQVQLVTQELKKEREMVVRTINNVQGGGGKDGPLVLQRLALDDAVGKLLSQLSSGDSRIMEHAFTKEALDQWDSLQKFRTPPYDVQLYLSRSHTVARKLLNIPFSFNHIYNLQTSTRGLDAVMYVALLYESVHTSYSTWTAAQMKANGTNNNDAATTAFTDWAREEISYAMDTAVFAEEMVYILTPTKVFDVFNSIVGSYQPQRLLSSSWTRSRAIVFPNITTTDLLLRFSLCGQEMYSAVILDLGDHRMDSDGALAGLVISSVFVVALVFMVGCIVRREESSTLQKFRQYSGGGSSFHALQNGNESAISSSRKESTNPYHSTTSPHPGLNVSIGGETYNTILSLHLNHYSTLAPEMIQFITQHEGHCVIMQRSYLTVVFKTPAASVACATQVLQQYPDKSISIAIHATAVEVRPLSDKCTLIDAVDLDYADGLLRLAVSQHAHVLISQKLKDGLQTTPLESVEMRYFGTLCTAQVVHPEIVYELYGADPPESRTAKENTSRAWNEMMTHPTLETALTLHKASEENPQDLPLIKKLELYKATLDWRSTRCFAVALLSGDGYATPSGTPRVPQTTTHTSAVVAHPLDTTSTADHSSTLPGTPQRLAEGLPLGGGVGGGNIPSPIAPAASPDTDAVHRSLIMQ